MTAEIFDAEGLLDRMLGDEEIARVVCLQWLGDISAEVATLSTALETGDIATSKRAAHSLKGASRSLGCDAVGSIAAQMEDLCGAGNCAAAAAMLDVLKRYVADTVPLVERFCGPA